MALVRNPDGTITQCCCESEIVDCDNIPICPHFEPSCLNFINCPPTVNISSENLSLVELFDIVIGVTSGAGCDTFPSPTSGLYPNNSCLEIAVEGSTTVTSITINYTDGADFANQLEAWFTSEFGGTWDVAVSISTTGFFIGAITGTGSSFDSSSDNAEMIINDCSNNFLSCYIMDSTAAETCALIIATNGLLNNIPVEPTGVCTYSGSNTVGGTCNSTIQVDVSIAAAGITVDVQIIDNVTTNVIASATYFTNSNSAPYDCGAGDDCYDLNLQSGFNTGGIIDWSDAIIGSICFFN